MLTGGEAGYDLGLLVLNTADRGPGWLGPVLYGLVASVRCSFSVFILNMAEPC